MMLCKVKDLLQKYTVTAFFHPLEVVDRGSETQLQESEKLSLSRQLRYMYTISERIWMTLYMLIFFIEIWSLLNRKFS